MFFDFDRTEPEKIVRALSTCLWMMNSEILDHSLTTQDRFITEHLKQMQRCCMRIAGYLADDIPPSHAYDLIPNENVLGVFGDRQSGHIKRSWIRFCDLLANVVGKEPIYGRNDPIDTKSDINVIWYRTIGHYHGFLARCSGWRFLFKKVMVVRDASEVAAIVNGYKSD